MSCGCCCGGISKVDVNEEGIFEGFNEAVKDYNAKQGESLELVKVVEATRQVVAGWMLEGVIEAKKNGVVAQYDVKVWIKPGRQGIQVEKFQAK